MIHPMLIDSHCHLDLPAFDLDLSMVIEHAYEAGVQAFVIPGVHASGWRRQLELNQRYECCFVAFGLHPCFLDDHQEGDIQKLQEWVDNTPQTLAIGEIGLDYYVESLDRDRQLFYFEQQIALARRFQLPVILHVRKAHDEVLKVLRKAQLERGGIVHAYSGSEQQAYQYLDLGFKLGFGGASTFDRAKKLQRLIKSLPIECFVMETDAPDIPPAFAAGERNSPELLPKIAMHIAEVRGMWFEDFAFATVSNTLEVLSIPNFDFT